jgi:hypothetical protein
VLGDLQSMCLRHDLPFSFCASRFLCFVLLLSLFLVGFISSLPQLAWDKRLSCCCCLYTRIILFLVPLPHSYAYETFPHPFHLPHTHGPERGKVRKKLLVEIREKRGRSGNREHDVQQSTRPLNASCFPLVS